MNQSNDDNVWKDFLDNLVKRDEQYGKDVGVYNANAKFINDNLTNISHYHNYQTRELLYATKENQLMMLLMFSFFLTATNLVFPALIVTFIAFWQGFKLIKLSDDLHKYKTEYEDCTNGSK